MPPTPQMGDRVDAQQLGRDVDAGTVVTGSYVLRGDSMMIEARIINVANGRVARAVEPVVAHRTDPLAAVELLRQRVAGALASELDRVITALVREGSQPPTYEAYLAWVRGLDLFSRVDFAGAIPFFLRAAALDSNFVAPLLWAAASHGNLGQMRPCDSLVQVVKGRSAQLGPLDRGLLDLWIANMKGDHAGRYNAAKRMLQEAPSSEQALFLVGWTATSALRTNEAIAALRRIPVERSRVHWDLYGIGLARAYHAARRYSEELNEARRRRRSTPYWLLAMEDEGRALATLGRSEELLRLTADIVAIAPQAARTAGRTLIVVASEAFFHGHADDGLATLHRFDAWVEAQPPELRHSFDIRRLVAMARYYQRDWWAADSMLTALVAARPQDPELPGWLGATAAQRGDTARALHLTAALAALDVPYLLGANTLARARIATVLGRRAEAIALTRQSIAEGQEYESIHRLPELQSLRGEPEFDQMLRTVE
ncbi:MAG: FlgO family outer membrane protein [Gemmatimonadota bacterium]